MTHSALVAAWLTPPRLSAPAFSIEPRRFTLRLPAQPLPAFPTEHYPEPLGANAEVVCYEWPAPGPTVLLAHGWGGCAAQFTTWLGPLTEAGFRVVAYDAPGHGASAGTFSSAPANGGTIRALAQHEGKPFDAIIAHSLGAIATTLALADGAAAGRLIFLAPCCYVLDSLENLGSAEGNTPEDNAALVRYFVESFGSDLTLLTARARLAAPPPLTIFHDPTDSEVPFAEAEAIAADWPGAALIPVARVGHKRILIAKGVTQHVLDQLRE